MGKAGRQRRLKKEKERLRQRAARDSGSSSKPTPWPEFQVPAPSQSEIVASLIGEAVAAVCQHDQEAYDADLRQLASERTPAWTQAVSRSLVEALRAMVTTAWRHGWQPAELARHASRELSGEHVRVLTDMIVIEMRGYAAATVDARWATQVSALAAASPGTQTDGNDARYLESSRKVAGDAGLRGLIATAIETVHLLQHLVPLGRLLPLPGTVRPAAKPHDAQPADERMLSKIRALLAKAESTEFAEEAEALSARAQQLMAKYSIDHALLAAETGRKEDPGGRRIAVDNPYEGPKVSLLQAVAQANRCRVVWSRQVGLVTVIGFPPDLEAVELLFTSLLVQANTAMLRAGAKRDSAGRSRTRAFRQSFLVAYAVRIGERLTDATGQAEQEAVASVASAGAGKDLVPFLAARGQAVDDAVEAMFGDNLTRGRAVRASDLEGWQSGRAAADMASLHNRAPLADAGSHT